MTDPTRICTKCRRDLPATPEYFHRKGEGFKPACKECSRASASEADLTRIPLELELSTGPESRLLVRDYTNSYGRRFVALASEYLDHSGAWRLAQSIGLVLEPAVARELAPALLTMAATIDGAPVDPMPTAEDREESRMP